MSSSAERPHPFRVLVEARGQLVQHPIVLAQRLEIVDARNPAVEHPRKRARAVARRPVAARPEVREQRIGLVRLALIGPIRVRGPRFLLGGARDAVRRVRLLELRAVRRVRREILLRSGLGRADVFLRRVDDGVLRRALLLELRERVLLACRARRRPRPARRRASRGAPSRACRSRRAHRRPPLSISRSRIRASTLNTPSSAWRCFSSSVVERSSARRDRFELAARAVEHPLDHAEHVAAGHCLLNHGLLPLRDRGARRRHGVLWVELAAALRADDVLLDDAVVALVGRDAFVGGLVDAQPPPSNRGRASRSPRCGSES